jgi:hypothetical protein
MCELGMCLYTETGGARVVARAVELFRVAAELGCREAQVQLGESAYGKLDWERFYWWGCAAERGLFRPLLEAVAQLLPRFASGENGRILHTVARVIRRSVDVANRRVFGEDVTEAELACCQQVIASHDALLERARVALLCWSMAGRRCRVVKDTRVMVAKMAWEEVWRWGERDE